LQNTLNSLIRLQEIDLNLDNLQEERGDLPKVVNQLKEKIEKLEAKIESDKKIVTDSKVEIKKLELEVNSLSQQLKKYEDQLYQVKTNKEYDAISHETENVKSKNNEFENTILELEEKIETLSKQSEEDAKTLESYKTEYEDSNAELQTKISESSEEENILLQEKEIACNNLTKQQINTYNLIRKAKKGTAVAYCNGGICSGCFSFIPPQKVVEIRTMIKMFTCEACGRILVWNQNEE